MHKAVIQVFLVIGTLVFVFLMWQLIFKQGGILQTSYTSLANVINTQWARSAGEGQTIMPVWEIHAPIDTSGYYWVI